MFATQTPMEQPRARVARVARNGVERRRVEVLSQPQSLGFRESARVCVCVSAPEPEAEPASVQVQFQNVLHPKIDLLQCLQCLG